MATEESGPTLSPRLVSPRQHSTPRADVQPVFATTEQSGWPKDAPWRQSDYVHPDDCTILCPDEGNTFHHSVPRNQRVDAKKGRIDYRGKEYSQSYMNDASHALIKCIRHSTILPTDAKGWAYLTDVTFAW